MLRMRDHSIATIVSSVVLSAFAVALGGCSSSDGVSREVTPTPPAQEDGRTVAVRAIEALLAGDAPAYVNETAPSETRPGATDSRLSDLIRRVKGCRSRGAEVSVVDKRVALGHNEVTLTFTGACGGADSEPSVRACSLLVANIIGRWFVIGERIPTCE